MRNRVIKSALACALLACASAAQEAVTVRILPQPLSTNREPFRIGLQMGFPAGPSSPLSAECLAGQPVAAETNVTVETLCDPNTGRPFFRVANASGRPGGLFVDSAALRKGVGHTVRLSCRLVKGPPGMRFLFMLSGDAANGAAKKVAPVKGEGALEKAFAMKPHKDGVYRCGFQVEPGGVMEFSDLSMRPDDAEEGWSGPALEALRSAELPAVRWPVAPGLSAYNWYQGVGPLELRQAPASGAPGAAEFGTAEFVRLCRLIGAEPVLRVTVPPFGRAGVDAERTRQDAQRTADWVAYCNAPAGQPLARLRARHGLAEPLGVSRWELFTPEGELFEGVVREFQEAMRAAAAAPGIAVACAEAPLAEARDRYVAEVLRRLQAAAPAERSYYADWYGALSLANDALARLRAGSGTVFWPDPPERLLSPAQQARRQLTERGQLVALFNRFPAQTPLAVEGASASALSPFQVVAAWTADGGALVVFVYNSGTEARRVRLDLTAMKRSFAFWAAEQLAADLAARRATGAVPVLRKQKAGSALPQVVLFDSLPASVSRLVIKR